MKFNVGDRVHIGGDLSRWTQMAQQNLQGVTGVVKMYKHDYDGRNSPAYLVDLDTPVQVNPITTFKSAWLRPENLF